MLCGSKIPTFANAENSSSAVFRLPVILFKPQCLTTPDSVLLPQAMPFPAMRFRLKILANAKNNSGRDFSGCLCYGLKGSLKTRETVDVAFQAAFIVAPRKCNVLRPNHAANRQPESPKLVFRLPFVFQKTLFVFRLHAINPPPPKLRRCAAINQKIATADIAAS